FFIVVEFSTSDPTNTLAMLREQWTFSVTNRSGAVADVHAWALSGGTWLSATESDDDAFLCGTPAVGPATVSVAAVVSRITWKNVVPAPNNTFTDGTQPGLHQIVTFSSPGPLRAASRPPETRFATQVHHEINAVDVAAPGLWIQSAMAADSAYPPHLQVNNLSAMLTGTSMAAPVVTGVIANLLAANNALTLPDVLQRLHAASSIPADSPFQPPPPGGEPHGTPPGHPGYSRDWGYGLLDASRLAP